MSVPSYLPTIGTARPYPETGITTAQWRALPVVEVEWARLTTTQDQLDLATVIDPERVREGGDAFPHVVSYRGDLYLEDGHHRVARSIIQGYDRGPVRIFEAG